jgi:DHA1 family bicyclomycin/chloramphenicol resistance-like MFS transporter
MNQKQRFFTDRSMLAMLALLSAFPPLSTDLYLPALPQMAALMDTTRGTANLTMSLFMIFFAMGMLFWGPVSEKYGRKPVLLTGLVLYILGSAGCALSTNMPWLIFARVFQAFGGGAAQAVSTAMVKDLYDGRKREMVLAVVMSMVIVAPVIAPVLGAAILKFLPWSALFWLLAFFGTISFLLSLLLTETLETRYSGSLAASLGRLWVVLKNPRFSVLLGIFSITPMPLMAFIAVSAFVYIDGFGMTESLYSYYFSFNALGAMVGPMVYMKISKRVTLETIVTGSFGILMICGIALNTAVGDAPVAFALAMAAATVVVSLLRVPAANLLLSQQAGDSGSASSLINFTAMIMGGLGMFLIGLEPGNLIPVLGLMQILVGSVCGSLWLLVQGRAFIRGRSQ